MILARLIVGAWALSAISCSRPEPAPNVAVRPDLEPIPASAPSVDVGVQSPATATAAVNAEPPEPCASDGDCGYDPARGICGTDPRYNHQPPLIDQGILCYCEDHRCASLKVPPVPCESDASCAVRPDPRPHPVAASAAFPHERGKRCKDYRISTTCERTNICTMHRHACPSP